MAVLLDEPDALPVATLYAKLTELVLGLRGGVAGVGASPARGRHILVA